MNRQTRSLGISGSLRRESYNSAALRAAAGLAPEGAVLHAPFVRFTDRAALEAHGLSQNTRPHDSEASIIFGKGVTSKPGSARRLVLVVDVATLADLLHETAEHYKHHEKTHAQHN